MFLSFLVKTPNLARSSKKLEMENYGLYFLGWACTTYFDINAGSLYMYSSLHLIIRLKNAIKLLSRRHLRKSFWQIDLSSVNFNLAKEKTCNTIYCLSVHGVKKVKSSIFFYSESHKIEWNRKTYFRLKF